MMMNLAFHSVLAYMRHTHQDSTPLLLTASVGSGLSQVEIADWSMQKTPSVILSSPLVIKLLNQAVQLTGNDCIGIDASKHTSFSGFEGFGVVLLSCSSISEAIDLFIKFKPILANILEVRRITENNDEFGVKITHEYGDPTYVMDFILSVLVRIGRRITQNINLTPLHLQLERPSSDAFPDRFYEFYRCNINFSGTDNVIKLIPESIHCTPELSNSEMSSIGLQWCEQKEREMLAKLEVRVGRLIEQHISDTTFSVDCAAKTLNMSKRKLQKELQQIDLSFSSLQDRIRREKSVNLLRYSEKSISEISDEAGYANETGFIRAFKRWEGITPASFRRRGEQNQISNA